MKTFLLAILVLAVSANAQMFTEHPADETGLNQAVVSWYQQDSALGWWPFSLTTGRFYGPNRADLAIFQHTGAKGRIFKNHFSETGQLTFTDETISLIADPHTLPSSLEYDDPRPVDFFGSGYDGFAGLRYSSQTSFENGPNGLTLLGTGIFNGPTRVFNLDLNGDGCGDFWGTQTLYTGGFQYSQYLCNQTQHSFTKTTAPYVRQPWMPAAWDTLPYTGADVNVFFFQIDLNGDGLIDGAMAIHKGHAGGAASAAQGRYCLRQQDGSCLDSTAAMGLSNIGEPILIQDATGDGKPEIFVSEGDAISNTLCTAGDCGLFVNDGAGHFSLAAGPLTEALRPYDAWEHFIEPVDFDKDNLPDYVFTNGEVNASSLPIWRERVFHNLGSGQFEEVITTQAAAVHPAVVNDFNGDGCLDVAILHQFVSTSRPGDISIYTQNNCAPPPPPPNPPTISTTSPLPPATWNQSYDQPIQVTGGTPPYTCTLTGTLPPGLTLQGCAITGVPVPQFGVSIRVTDSQGQSDTKSLELPVQPSGGAQLLLLDAPTLARIKQDAAAKTADYLALKARADQLLPLPVLAPGATGTGITYGFGGGNWHEAVRVLGLTYLASGDVRYGDKVEEVVDQMVVAGTAAITPDRAYATREVAFAAGLAYSWAGDRLSPARRSGLIATINGWFDWCKAASALDCYSKGGPAENNYFEGHILGFGAAAYATADANPRADEIKQWVADRFKLIVDSFDHGLYQGGYPVEGMSYGPYGILYALQYMQIARDPNLKPIARKLARHLLYELKPNRWQTTDEGDNPGDYTGIFPGFLPLTLARVLLGEPEGAWMEWMYRHLAKPPSNAYRLQQPDVTARVLNEDAARTMTDYRLTEPLAYCSAGDGHLFARSSWDDDAVWMSFMGGTTIMGHDAQNAGHVSVQRGEDYMLINAGQWHDTNGTYGSPTAYDRSSWRFNTLFFDDFGEYLYKGVYVGGQGVFGNVNNFTCQVRTDGSAIAVADLTSAYDRKVGDRNDAKRSLRHFIRTVEFSGSTILVTDEVEVLKPEYIKKIFWHFNPSGTASVSGNLVSYTRGASSLTLEVLEPATAAITLVPDGRRNFTDTESLTKRIEIAGTGQSTRLRVVQKITVGAL